MAAQNAVTVEYNDNTIIEIADFVFGYFRQGVRSYIHRGYYTVLTRFQHAKTKKLVTRDYRGQSRPSLKYWSRLW
ncbi:hypothetical protein [Roseibium sp.]|uniref:hypothetical protein n=1 Tax=Roseibium sp. TaxID=1936156 RepID=UPI003D0A8EE3